MPVQVVTEEVRFQSFYNADRDSKSILLPIDRFGFPAGLISKRPVDANSRDRRLRAPLDLEPVLPILQSLCKRHKGLDTRVFDSRRCEFIHKLGHDSPLYLKPLVDRPFEDLEAVFKVPISRFDDNASGT